MMSSSFTALNHTKGQIELQSKWGWFVAIGAILVLLGFMAFGNLVWATSVTVLYVGALMIFGAAASIIHAFQVRDWSGFIGWSLSALLYGFAGVFAFTNPLLTASTLTLVLAISLIVSGVMRLWSGSQLRSQAGRVWMIVSAVVTSLAGVVFFIGWPFNSLFLLGMLLAFDLTFQGLSTIALGISLKGK